MSLSTTSKNATIPANKFLLKNKAGECFGPIHWKHLSEWNEMELLDGFTYKTADNTFAPIAQLVENWKTPPSIVFNAMILAPSESDTSCSKKILNELLTLGFPKIDTHISNELATHLKKRLQMSRQSLAAEDPEFTGPIQILQPRASAPLPGTASAPETTKPAKVCPVTPQIPWKMLFSAMLALILIGLGAFMLFSQKSLPPEAPQLNFGKDPILVPVDATLSAKTTKVTALAEPLPKKTASTDALMLADLIELSQKAIGVQPD